MGKTTPRQAYKALQKAADKMGDKNYRKQLRAHKKRGRKASTFKFTVTPAHKQVVNAMPKVLSGQISVEEGMAILHEPDVMEERL
jgi:hypothetical protein